MSVQKEFDSHSILIRSSEASEVAGSLDLFPDAPITVRLSTSIIAASIESRDGVLEQGYSQE